MFIASDDPLEIQEVKDRKQLKMFIQLPFEIHKGHSLWVPPLLSEEWKYFDSKKNPSFSKNDTILLLAFRNGKPVGRIIGIINSERNNRLCQSNAHFCNLECPEDLSVAKALLNTLEDWAIRKGIAQMAGPMGFSDQEPEGYLIKGFELEPSISTYSNFEYLPVLLEQSGYSKEVDYVVYQIDLNKLTPDLYLKIIERFQIKEKYQFQNFKKKKELKPYIKPVLKLVNEIFGDSYGYDPMTDEEIRLVGKQYLQVIDPRFVIIAKKDSEIIGFLIGIPNLNYGFRKAKGHLFPVGFYHLWRAPFKTKQFDLLLGGLRSEFRGMGIDACGMLAIIEEARDAGYTLMDSHHELETNMSVRKEMERLGGEIKKRFRIYKKQLTE